MKKQSETTSLSLYLLTGGVFQKKKTCLTVVMYFSHRSRLIDWNWLVVGSTDKKPTHTVWLTAQKHWALSSKEKSIKNVNKTKAQNKLFKLIFCEPNIARFVVTHCRRISIKYLKTSHISGWSGSQVSAIKPEKSRFSSQPNTTAAEFTD